MLLILSIRIESRVVSMLGSHSTLSCTSTPFLLSSFQTGFKLFTLALAILLFQFPKWLGLQTEPTRLQLNFKFLHKSKLISELISTSITGLRHGRKDQVGCHSP